MRFIFLQLLLLIAVSVSADKPAPELEITELLPNVFLHLSHKHVQSFGLVGSNGLILVKGKKAFLIDTPWPEKDTDKLLQWLKNKNLKIVGSISTHSHDDRTAGIERLNAEAIPTYAYSLTNNILKEQGKPLAKNTIKKNGAKLFGGEIEVYYPGGGHTVDNVVVWLPKHKLLFGGCFVRSLEWMSLGYIGEARVKAWSSSVEKVVQRYPKVKTVVPGHGKAGDHRLLAHTKVLAEKKVAAMAKREASDKKQNL